MEDHSLSSLPARNPANELYDRACDLLEAAQGMRRAIEHPGHEPALIATLGCLTEAVKELTSAIECVRTVSSPQRRPATPVAR